MKKEEKIKVIGIPLQPFGPGNASTVRLSQDTLGSYTGHTDVPGEEPVQDADDL